MSVDEQKKDKEKDDVAAGASGLELAASPVSAKEPERASLDDVIPPSSIPSAPPPSSQYESDPPNSARIVPKPISSNPIVIADSFPPASEDVPPSMRTVIENTMNKGRTPMPLSTIIGIAGGVFVVLIALSLLLFR